MKIYGVRIETVEQLPCEFIKSLMPKRYERSEKYLRKADQLRCLGAGLLMHRVLGVKESELLYGKYGKPYVPGMSGFSVSHGGDWAVLATKSHVTGVDIEPMDYDNLSVANRVFTDRELHWMRQDPLVRFHILWTLKESVMKATGLGLQLDPICFEVIPESNISCVEGTTWHTAWMLHDGCAVACASDTRIEKLTFTEIFF